MLGAAPLLPAVRQAVRQAVCRQAGVLVETRGEALARAPSTACRTSSTSAHLLPARPPLTADNFNWCFVPLSGSDAFLFVSLALIACGCLFGKLSAVWVLVAGERTSPTGGVAVLPLPLPLPPPPRRCCCWRCSLFWLLLRSLASWVSAAVTTSGWPTQTHSPWLLATGGNGTTVPACATCWQRRSAQALPFPCLCCAGGVLGVVNNYAHLLHIKASMLSACHLFIIHSHRRRAGRGEQLRQPAPHLQQHYPLAGHLPARPLLLCGANLLYTCRYCLPCGFGAGRVDGKRSCCMPAPHESLCCPLGRRRPCCHGCPLQFCHPACCRRSSPAKPRC